MDYSYIRENFDINSISKSILSIQVCLDGFSFVITPSDSPQSPEYIYITRMEVRSYEELINALTSFTGFDLKEFYAIRIMVHENGFALIPENIFDLKDTKAYLKLNHPHRIESKSLSNRIAPAGAVCVFSMDHGLYDLLRKKFPGADFCHTSLPFCTMAINKSIDGCFIQCYEKSMELAVVKNQKLLLYNVFDLHDENDMIYFVLNAYKSTSLDSFTHPLFISGILAKNSETVALTGKYIKDIRFYSPAYIVVPEEGEFQFPSHFFINHREIQSCAL